MAFADLLTHTVSIIRKHDAGTLDAHGQPVTTDSALSTVKAAIQPRTGRAERERDAISQAGAAQSDHTIFLLPTEVTTGDAILHDASTCPLARDLPTQRYEIVGVPNAAGLGHHLELFVRASGTLSAEAAS